MEKSSKQPHRMEDDLVNAIRDDAIGDENRAELYAEWVSECTTRGISEIEDFLGKYAAFLAFVETQDTQTDQE